MKIEIVLIICLILLIFSIMFVAHEIKQDKNYSQLMQILENDYQLT